MKKFFIKKNGISLIVLIITIIVIIILASAVILSLSQNNPIAAANEAEFKQDVSEYKNELALYELDQYAKDKGGFDTTTLNSPSTKYPNIQDIITSMKQDDTLKFAIEKGELVYLDDKLSADEKEWANDMGLKSPQESGSGTTTYTKANDAVDEGTSGTTITENSTIDGQVPSYNDPVIPAGFFAVNTDIAKWTNVSTDWNNGLVIQDNYGNQFVWVPVDGTDVVYSKEFSYPSTYDASSSNTSDDTFPEGLNETTLANKYQGFYIGRYETSNNSGKAASKKADVWNFISYTDSKSHAESAGTSYGYDATKVGTNLITGTEWDTVMKWVKKAGIDVSTNTSGYGNYNNSTAPADVSGYGNLQVTGYSTYWRVKNIYDLAGNVWEWTNEKYSTYYVLRGAGFDNTGDGCPLALRNYDFANASNYDVGFRIALYIK